eukprot:6486525-Amphidinium_carterae.2
MDNVYEKDEMRKVDNEYREIDEFKETMEYSEYTQQTLRLSNEMEEMTIAMIKMNIKLPTPTVYDGRSHNSMSGQKRSSHTLQSTISTSTISWMTAPRRKYQWSLLQCRETQSHKTLLNRALALIHKKHPCVSIFIVQNAEASV